MAVTPTKPIPTYVNKWDRLYVEDAQTSSGATAVMNASYTNKTSGVWNSKPGPYVQLLAWISSPTDTTVNVQWKLTYHSPYRIESPGLIDNDLLRVCLVKYGNDEPISKDVALVTVLDEAGDDIPTEAEYFAAYDPNAATTKYSAEIDHGTISGVVRKKDSHNISIYVEIGWNHTINGESKVKESFYTMLPIPAKDASVSSSTEEPQNGKPADPGKAGTVNDSTSRKWTADWSTEYPFDLDKDAPTETPPAPSIEIEDDIMTITLTSEDSIWSSDYGLDVVYDVIQDNTTRVYAEGSIAAHFSKDNKPTITNVLTTTLHISEGHRYKVRCKTVKTIPPDNIIKESQWSNWSNEAESRPVPPEKFTAYRAISSTGTDADSAYLEWTGSKTADTYELQYCTNKYLFTEDDSSDGLQSVTGIKGTKYTKTGLEAGQTYYFRVRAVGEDTNAVSKWSWYAGSDNSDGVASVIIGTTPTAPTTWSYKSTITVGEPVTLYWVHNSEDGSSETSANINVRVESAPKAEKFTAGMQVVADKYYANDTSKYLCIRSGTPDSLDDEFYFEYDGEVYINIVIPTQYKPARFYDGMYVEENKYYTDGTAKYLCIKSGNPEGINDTAFFTKVSEEYDEKETSYYVLETDGVMFQEGATIKWQVQTAGILGNSYGPWSTERPIEVHAKPTLELTVTNNEGVAFDALTSLPIHVKGLTGPKSQIPIGYYLSITANESYVTRDAIGNPKVVQKGDLVFNKYYDQNEPLDVILSAGDITLENNHTYTISCIASMNSGLTVTTTLPPFMVSWTNEMFLPNATVLLNNTTYAAAIRPYCEEKTTRWHKVTIEEPGRYVLGEVITEDVDTRPLVKAIYPIGKNLLDLKTIIESNYCDPVYLNGTLSITKTDSNSYARVLPMYLLADTTYILSYTSSDDSVYAYWYKGEETDGEPVSITNIFTPTETGYYHIAFHLGMDISIDSTVEITKAQVEEGDTATAYEAYQGVDVITEYTTTGEQVYVSAVTGTDYYSPVVETKLIDGVVLAIYRRNYDGSFTEIQSGIKNANVYVPDPHPALDYARYRVVATSSKTGAVSYYDLPSYRVGCKSIVIQWEEDWNNYDATRPVADTKLWTGSLLTLPYNIDVTDKRSVEVEMVKYVGRQHPVSYYGTHLGETSSWSCAIPKTDKETLYALRRLAMWPGDVYVREPSGVGYWANIIVNFSQKHGELTIPVSFDITRVEGGA